MKQNNQSEMLRVKLAYLGRISDGTLLGLENYKPDGCARVWRLSEVDHNGNIYHTITGFPVFTAMFYYLQGRIDAEEQHAALI